MSLGARLSELKSKGEVQRLELENRPVYYLLKIPAGTVEVPTIGRTVQLVQLTLFKVVKDELVECTDEELTAMRDWQPKNAKGMPTGWVKL